MINRSFFLLTFLLLASPVQALMVDIPHNKFTSNTYTHTPIELKPISFDNSYKVASVCFMGFGDCEPVNGFDYTIDSDNQCNQEGYIKNNCSSVQEPTEVCPYNKTYIKGCKCKSGLITCPLGQVGVGASCGGKYASCQCDPNLKTCASNQVGTGASCGGKYATCTCKSEYQFTSSNCSYPRSVSGSSCGGKYNNCVCPSGVSTGSYGCQEYYPSPCSSICKVAKSDNCDRKTAVQTPYGCMSYFADCPSKCERAYSDNCRNRTAVTCQFGCTSYFADCQTKCQSCSSDNCANRTAVSTPYGCQTYWADCSSKCQTAYPDNCRNRTAISVPANASCSAYFSDCSSKCSAWSCNSGYKKSGNNCVRSAYCSDGGFLSSIPASNTCDQTTYQGLTCYMNCKRPVNIYEVWPDDANICAGGPYIAPGYKKPGDNLYSRFPRSECVSGTMNKTSLTLPVGASIRINTQQHMGHTLCALARRTPAFPYHRISCDNWGECNFKVENMEGYSDFMDIYVIYRKTDQSSVRVNGASIACDY